MSEVISLLERLGQDSGMRQLFLEGTAPAVASPAQAALREALASADGGVLEALLGASSNLVCGLFPGKEDQPGEESPDKDDEQPDEDDEKIALPHRSSAIASAR
ncbi:MAG: hypothetical protein ABIP49_05980 [Lysobacterales bacterium]